MMVLDGHKTMPVRGVDVTVNDSMTVVGGIVTVVGCSTVVRLGGWVTVLPGWVIKTVMVVG